MDIRSLKPAAPVWVHLTLAALLWTAVGGTLFVVGARWALTWRSGWAVPVLAGAVLVGLAKGVFVMRRAARRNVRRIRERGDGYCIGGFLGWKIWLLVGLMITLGRVLRSGLLPTSTVGFVYAGVGAALMLGALSLWRGLADHRAGRPLPPGGERPAEA